MRMTGLMVEDAMRASHVTIVWRRLPERLAGGAPISLLRRTGKTGLGGVICKIGLFGKGGMDRDLRAQHGTEGAQAFDVVHARVLRFFPELVETLGGDCRAMLRQAGIDQANITDNDFAATYRQMIEVFEIAARELQCPDFGMRLATLQGGNIFGPLGLVMKNSGSFGEALDYVVKHTFAHSPAARIWLRRFPAEEMVFSGHDILLDRIQTKSQAVEQLMLVGHLTALELTGGQVRARKVHFRHQPVSSRATYRRYFSCEVCFGQNEDGVYFSTDDMACPIIGADPDARTIATMFIDTEFAQHRPPLHALVQGMILQYLGTDECTNDKIAAELNLHPRTLHRRLAAEETSFQKIKDEVRRDFMLYYIQKTDADFCGISEKLGFAEQSVMSRYCNRWFSISPSELRMQGQDGGAKSRVLPVR
jgi:AraC-like DNA-binding protein